ncbi:hypothetical protein FRUB_03607 [Fimbriiglobus ruber]|uniref:Uncharacterized protein n=1 Tax=Fimbriiglobus ruber TaxID=1908690 RepID=A0A225DZP0_9BACT|nr:hypothetical protein FRUB_03607 [Fimbriiglobus ruber]
MICPKKPKSGIPVSPSIGGIESVTRPTEYKSDTVTVTAVEKTWDSGPANT